MSPANIHTPDRGKRTFPLAALLILLLTAAISLLWSHHKLLSQDEIFVLQTDSVDSVSQLIHIQRTVPISLDPLVYHLLAHAATRLFGATAFALRLPSLFGYLLMQLCLFYIVRRYASDRAALFAMAFPALTATLFYSAEARPYGLLLGFYALTLLAWLNAISAVPNRTPWLITLTLAIALTLNSHYFGILLLIPLCAAELARIAERRRLDLPVAAAIIAGMACIVFTLPFQHAAGEFRKHYYNGGTVSLRAITQSYRALFIDYTHLSAAVQRSIAFAFICLAAIFVIACIQLLRRRTLPLAEAVFLVTLAALPLFGFLLARFVTHSIEVRYVLGSIIGITILLALALAPLLDRIRSTPAILCLAIGCIGFLHIRDEKQTEQNTFASLTIPAELKAAVLASPSQRLYIQDMGHFDAATLYADPFVRSHIALLYSRDNEIRYDGHDTASLTALHMRSFTTYTIVDYDTLKQLPGPHIAVLFHSGWNWTDQALAADHAHITPLATIGEGTATSLTFPTKPHSS